MFESAEFDFAKDEQYMRAALREAEKAFEAGEVPVGAVVVQGGKIIGRGHNLVEQLNDPTAHAEMMALTAAFNTIGAKYLPDATLYVTVEPCLMCTGALYWSKIGRIVWGTSDPKNGHQRITGNYQTNGGQWPFHPKTTLQQGLLADECAELMKNFFKARRK